MPNSYTKPVSATDNTKVAKSGDTMSGALTGVAFLLQATANPGAGNHGFTRDGLGHGVLNAATGQAGILGYNNNGLNTGTGCLSWGSFGVKIANTGGTGHFLKQTSAGGAISSGALTPSDMPVQKCRVSRITSDQTGNAGGYTHNTVVFNSVDLNENSNLSWSSGVGTVVNTGKYDINAQVDCAGGECLIAIKVNSTIVAAIYRNGTGPTWDQVGIEDLSLTAGDTVKCIVAFGSGADIYYQHSGMGVSAGYATFMELVRVG